MLLDIIISKMVDTGMFFRILSASWDCDPILLPKRGSEKLSFMIELRSVNKYTVRNQLPIPKIEQKLGKISDARMF